MDKKALEFFKKLMAIPTPTGFEMEGQRLVAERVKPYADKIELDKHGNLIMIKNPNAKFRFVIDAHIDEIGFIVQHIDSKGFLRVQPLGGINNQLLPGERIILNGPKGPVHGCFGRKAIHLMDAKERGEGVKDISELWVDIGAKSLEEAMEWAPIGTSGVVNADWRDMLNDNVSMRGMDDRAGVFIMTEVLRKLAKRKINVGLYVVSATQEEVGLLGGQAAAYGIDPHGGIAVDVTFASDHPRGEEAKVGDIRLGGGPVIGRGPAFDVALNKLVDKAAEKVGIKTQTQIRNRGNGTDAFAIRMTRSGVPVNLISIPLRYMHSAVEIVNLKDIDEISTLIAETIAALPANPKLGPTL